MTISRDEARREYATAVSPHSCRQRTHGEATTAQTCGGPTNSLVDNGIVTRIVIIGGGPAGYEAALVAAQLDADVTVVEAAGAGGACVLDDCVPSKTFIASSDVVTAYRDPG